MSDVLTLVSQLTGMLLIATLLSSILSSALYGPVRRRLTAFDPHTRAATTLSYALITPAVGLIVVLLTSAPGTAHWLVFEHCHGSQCGTHAPLLAQGSVGNLTLVAGASLLLFGFATGVVKDLVAGRRQLLTLFNLGNKQQHYVVIDSDRPLALCCGLLKPQIVLSRALLQRFHSDQIRVILAHEQAHVARLDNLRNLAARWSTALWPSKLRKQLCDDLAAANEICYDAIAMRSAPESFERVVELMAAQSSLVTARPHVTFGTQQAAVRVQAASAEGTKHPLLAHILIAAVWTLQTVLVSASAHPVVEAITSAGT